jgi:hypothetical protein
VAKDPAFWDMVSLLEEANQFCVGFHLPGTWHGVVEVADEANSDTFLICPVSGCAAAVCAGQLSSPTVSRLDFASPLLVPLPITKS